MLQAPSKPRTFEELLNYDDGTDNDYELVDGELVLMPEESRKNGAIARALADLFKLFVGRDRIIPHTCQIAVPTMKGISRNRKPDLTILREEHIEQMDALGKQAITDDMQPPLLVVEVVSPGKRNYERDYVEKRLQYLERGILEYWIVDPQNDLVTVLVLDEEEGEPVWSEQKYRDDDLVRSPQFPDLEVSARQILEAEIP